MHKRTGLLPKRPVSDNFDSGDERLVSIGLMQAMLFEEEACVEERVSPTPIPDV